MFAGERDRNLLNCIKMLMNAGANPFLKDNRGNTVRSIAEINEDWEVVVVLEAQEEAWKNRAARLIQKAWQRSRECRGFPQPWADRYDRCWLIDYHPRALGEPRGGKRVIP